ncbi:MAG TPA: EAL domain-containing protein [Burkholderiaceae bacterium]
MKPLARTLTTAARRPAAQAPTSDRVLLVDDDPVVRLLTAAALTERGWRVIEAEDGERALALFAAERPQVVVLDAMMPPPDGFETCERLRRSAGGNHVPILMLTGLDDEDSIARAYEAGATDFFVKTSGQWTLLSERLRYMLRASRMREELVQSQAKLTKAQRIARLGSWEWDFEQRRLRLSDECCQIAGMPPQPDGIADWYAWSQVAEEDRVRIEQLFRDSLETGRQMNFECRLMRPDGQVRIVRVEAEVERDQDGRARATHGVMQDVTESKLAEDQIRRLANYDSLTGLPNRRFFREQFALTLDAARAADGLIALLFVDIDRFKQINDTLGHQIGDQMLREIAWRLHATVRETDTVARAADGVDDAHRQNGGPVTDEGNRVARLGGDEFTVLLTSIRCDEDLQRIMGRLLESMRQPIHCAGHEVFATASIGVARFPQDGVDVDSLLRKADLAMYAIKEQGGNDWRPFDEAMNTSTATRWHVEAGLHHALDRQELVLFYQPKIDAVTGCIVGAEALMRWKRDGRLVPPGDFIGAAEDSGLIVPITEWAIAEVCRQLDEWRRLGLPVQPVSVNISSRHFQRGNLVAPVHQSLGRHRLAPELLELELTETVLMSNLDVALPLLQSLKSLGVSISIDDFGTGYSSLAYLRRLPIDTLKIDRSFVRELESSPDSAAIVAAIIAMGRALKLRVVAEGVETRAQMLSLHAQNCRLMQGYLFARPLPADEFGRLLADSAGGRAEWKVTSAAALEERVS